MRRMSGFSLMEMMVVLLITAIVAAASAPMINKKLMHDQAESGSPWLYAGTGNSIVYNVKGSEKQTVSIGGVAQTEEKPALYIKTKEHPQIMLRDEKDDIKFEYINSNILIGTPGQHSDTVNTDGNIRIGLGTSAGNKSVVIGHGTAARANGIAIGLNAKSKGAVNENNARSGVSIGVDTTAEVDGIAIGEKANASTGSIAIGATSTDSGTIANGYATVIGGNAIGSSNAVAIGYNASAEERGVAIGGLLTRDKKAFAVEAGVDSIAIGSGAKAYITNAQSSSTNDSVAIGAGATAGHKNSTAIGAGATAGNKNSTAIGSGAQATLSNQIVLGTVNDTVYIPGNLVVDNIAVLGATGVDPYFSMDDDGTTKLHKISKGTLGLVQGDAYNDDIEGYTVDSDRRLKNVGKAFVGGLDEIKKLEVFNYTYKKDPTKTPHVGVMAQDLEKIFPNAVFKGDDGFLRIRMEDMFYAIVNAIKELDSKFEALRNNEIKTLQKQVADLEKQNKELLKRIEKIEKNLK